MTQRTRAALSCGIVQIMCSAVDIIIAQNPQQVRELKAVILWAAEIQKKPRKRQSSKRRPH